LQNLIIERYGDLSRGKTSVVRNGLKSDLIETGIVAEATHMVANVHPTKIAYFGTIAEWFDFDVLVAALNEIPGLEFHLLGPVSSPNVPSHARLKFHRPISHERLAEFAAGFDAFVMPFRVTPLIESVDPVKLYEYLAFGKEVLSVGYAEIDRFSHLVHFYRGPEEFVRLSTQLSKGNLIRKNTIDARTPFLAQSTWSTRAIQIAEILAALPVTAEA